jgi:SpoVK/Ycf46/Vps4 family AAA+-type ATPase
MAAVFARARMATPCLLVLEDIDSMIDDENRSFFLNELDGFESNTGLVVLATTNHADRLDQAILNRPSRFDRKYYFNLPGPEERRKYLAFWNEGLQDTSHLAKNSDTALFLHPKLRLSDEVIEKVVQQTENFSFAYLKELFLSTTMQWMSTRALTIESEPDHSSADQSSLETSILEVAKLLRTQMSASTASESPQSKSLLGGIKRALAHFRRFLAKASPAKT